MRCIDEEGTQIGVIPTSDARRRADQLGLDLVEISPNSSPPVCRIMDYGKYKYDREKREKDARKHQVTVKLKEVKFHANVEAHDYQTKLRHARDFISAGHRVKVSLFFRGRENAHQELGFDVLNRVMRDCDDVAQPDQIPRKMGRSIQMLLAPRKTSKGSR